MGQRRSSCREGWVEGDIKETLNKSFDRLRTNGKGLIPFVVNPSATLRRALSIPFVVILSNHERNQLIQGFLNNTAKIS